MRPGKRERTEIAQRDSVKRANKARAMAVPDMGGRYATVHLERGPTGSASPQTCGWYESNARSIARRARTV